MYDPFATPQPQPGMPQASPTAVPQVMPNPVPVEQNNALAAIAARLRAMHGSGVPQTPFGMGGYRQAMVDYRAGMPQRPTFDGQKPPDIQQQMDAFRQQRRDYRAQRPSIFDYRSTGA